jgi:hypothetical protein
METDDWVPQGSTDPFGPFGDMWNMDNLDVDIGSIDYNDIWGSR